MEYFSRGSEHRQEDNFRSVLRDELQQFAKTTLREEFTKACDALQQNLVRELEDMKSYQSEVTETMKEPQSERPDMKHVQSYGKSEIESNYAHGALWNSEASRSSNQKVQIASAPRGAGSLGSVQSSAISVREFKESPSLNSILSHTVSDTPNFKRQITGDNKGEVMFDMAGMDDHHSPPLTPSTMVLGEHQAIEDKVGPIGRRSTFTNSFPALGSFTPNTSGARESADRSSPSTVRAFGKSTFARSCESLSMSVAPMAASSHDDQSTAAKVSSRSAKNSKQRSKKVSRLSTASRPTGKSGTHSLKPSGLFSTKRFKSPTTKDLERSAKTETRPAGLRAVRDSELMSCIKLFSEGSNFARAFISICIFANGILIGLQTDRQARYVTDDMPTFYMVMEWIFCIIFTCELSINLYAHGLNFYTMPGRWWNIFDTLLVLTQLADLWGSIVKGASSRRLDFSFVRVLRILRLLRVLRLVRLLRFVDELSVIINSIKYTAQSLCWTVFLLLFMMYMVAIMFCQIVFMNRVELEEDSAELKLWWGSLGLGVLSLYEAILGGIDWDTLIRPLIEEISPLVGVLFCLYIAFALLAVMNVITGTFVQSSFRDATKEKHKDFVAAARVAFSDEDAVASHAFFLSVISEPKFANWLENMKIQPVEAMLLYSILEKEDEDGKVDTERLVDGLARMGEGAKFMDIMKIMYEHYRFQEWAVCVEEGFNHLDCRFDGMAKEITSTVLTNTNKYLEVQFGLMTDSLVNNRLSV